jgi:hypothetical protein
LSAGAGYPAGQQRTSAGDPAGDVRVDRLALRVAGLDEDEARALARLVAEGLAPGTLAAAGSAGLSRLRIEVQADAGQGDPALLARRIIDQIGRALARDRAPGGRDGEALQ